MLIGETRLRGRPTFTEALTLREGVERWRDNEDARGPAWTELRQAMGEAQLYADNFTGREASTFEAYRGRNEVIHRLTGVQLDNPFELTVTGPAQADERREKLAEWRARVTELRGANPDFASELDPDVVERDTRRIVRGAEARREAALGDPALGMVERLGASLIGAGGSWLRDPVQLSALLASVPLSAGSGAATVTGRIAQTMLTEAVINAGLEVPLAAAAQRWRAENDLDAGFRQGLEQVGLAGLFGAGAGGLFQGISETLRLLDKATPETLAVAQRVAAGAPRAGDIDALAAALDMALPQLERDIARVAEDQLALDRAAFGDMPAGLDADGLGTLLNDAVRAAENPELPPPAGEPIVPPRGADEDRVISEAAERAPSSPERIVVRGRPAEFTRFDPSELMTDAQTYQYKGDADEAGVTERLREVRQWDDTASGKIFVHERADGRFVADGHQRLGLARRLQGEGQDVRLDGFLFREADGWTAAEIRALAAKKNMQEGSGTALDAARILRDRPDLIDDGLPISGPMMRKGLALAKLSDDAWGLIVNGIAAEHHGAAVGRLVPDADRHGAVLSELARANPESERQTELYVREIMAAGFNRETQSDMFGDLKVTRSLMAERVKILDEAMKALSKDKRLFAALADNAELIETVGNRLDTEGNVGVARTAETVMGVVDRLARTRGPVSDLLNQAAERYAGGAAASKEARAFVAAVGEAIERDGLAALLEGRPAPVLKPAAAVEPATPDGEAVAALARAEAGGELTAGDMTGQPSIWDMLPDGIDAEGKPRFTDAARERDKAATIDEAADLIAACKD